MKDLLDLIIKNITLNPDEAQVDEEVQGDTVVYTIHVHPDDMGRVIGKAGKVIKAIRSLSHVVAIRKNQHFRINVAEAGEAGIAESTSMPEPQTTPETEFVIEAEESAVPVAESDILADALDTEE